MCGNFNFKSIDDMKNPQNVIETSVANFGNSWKVRVANNNSKIKINYLLSVPFSG